MAYQFRKCCDSPVGESNPHIKGCVNAHKAVEISMMELTPEGMTLRVRDFDGNTLAEGVTVEDVFEHPTWFVGSVFYPLDNEIPAVEIRNPHQYTAALKSLNEQRERLIYDGVRTDDPFGEYRTLVRKIDVQKMITAVVIHSLLGTWPHQFRDLGL